MAEDFKRMLGIGSRPATAVSSSASVAPRPPIPGSDPSRLPSDMPPLPEPDEMLNLIKQIDSSSEKTMKNYNDFNVFYKTLKDELNEIAISIDELIDSAKHLKEIPKELEKLKETLNNKEQELIECTSNLNNNKKSLNKFKETQSQYMEILNKINNKIKEGEIKSNDFDNIKTQILAIKKRLEEEDAPSAVSGGKNNKFKKGGYNYSTLSKSAKLLNSLSSILSNNKQSKRQSKSQGKSKRNTKRKMYK